MQGYIINLNRVKDEDLIVTILTHSSIKTVYRFYGARHSTIHLGYKIDFEVIPSLKSSIPQLRSIMHLGTSWNTYRERMLIWQPFIRLFYTHLKDIATIDNFYFDLLEECSAIWHKQNPKRIAIEAYIKLLAYEGRLHDDFICFNCDEEISSDLTLIRGFLPAHKTCAWNQTFELLDVKQLFEEQSTIALNDEQIDVLWKILLEGF
ncbi:recombination protein RecO [Sulfurospirillum sp.]|jgi:recombinational DNA repair protein (RecF pathway)|uniref:recombination protein RecO n=1 Tax=Sulfurospirillum sp. TaxID=2053622 RepID=UPI002FDE66B6